MKNLFICLAIVSVSFPSLGHAIKGDVNKDGMVNAADSTSLEQALQNAVVPYQVDWDLDEDMLVDSYDLFRLKEWVAGRWGLDIRYPIRSFVLNAQGGPLGEKLDGEDTEHLAVLHELSASNGSLLKTWGNGADEFTYERMGNSRLDSCSNPPLNLEFDADDRFPAMSSYGPYPSLLYKKIRAVSDCNLWITDTDPKYIPVQLREYFSYNMLRIMGVPTVETIGFAEIEFSNSNPELPSRFSKGNYLLLQRDNQIKDQIPFAAQFGLSQVLESNNIGMTRIENFYSVSYWDQTSPNSLVEKKLPLSVNNSVRYFLMADFVELSDHEAFWNEDYGYDPVLDKWKSIPYDFDYSMISCDRANYPNWTPYAIVTEPGNQLQEGWDAYYNIGREFFGDPNNLNKLLLMIDRYPFPGSKVRLKHNVKTRFVSYALAFGSPSMAERVQKPHVPITNELYFLNEALKIINNPSGLKSSCPTIDLAALTAAINEEGSNSLPLQPPVILVQPQNVVGFINSFAKFNIEYSGSPATVEWQEQGTDGSWKKINSYDPTSFTIRITRDSAVRCRILNQAGEVLSDVARILMKIPPTVTSEFPILTVNMGDPAQLSVSAISEDPLTYRWYKLETAKRIELVERNGLSETNSPRLVFNSTLAGDRGDYVCLIISPWGSVTSSSMQLILLSRPTISSIFDISIDKNSNTGNIPFEVNDEDTSELVVTGISSIQSIVPNENIVIEGNGPQRIVTVTPLPNQSGAPIITLTVSDGDQTASETFVVNIIDNHAPQISFISSQRVKPVQKTISVPITISDQEDSLETINIQAQSSNQTFLSNSNLVVQSLNTPPYTHRLQLTPNFGPEGRSATVTVTVSDGKLSTTRAFSLVWENTPPVVSSIPDQWVDYGVESLVVTFTVDDIDEKIIQTDLRGPEISLENYQIFKNVEVSSLYFDPDDQKHHGNITLVPSGLAGTSKVNFVITDSMGGNAYKEFQVFAVEPLSLSPIANQTVAEDQQTDNLQFSIFSEYELLVTPTTRVWSTNQSLVANEDIFVTVVNDYTRALRIVPKLNQFGAAKIFLEVLDEHGIGQQNSFDLTVTPVNDVPFMSTMENQIMAINTILGPLAFTVGDLDNPSSQLTVKAVSSNPELIPNNQIIITGNSESRAITVQPALNKFGTAEISLVVTDKEGSEFQTSFQLKINEDIKKPTTLQIVLRNNLEIENGETIEIEPQFVIDEGLNVNDYSLNTHWETVAEPGVVRIVQLGKKFLMTFTGPGLYRLRYHASLGALESMKEFDVVVRQSVIDVEDEGGIEFSEFSTNIVLPGKGIEGKLAFNLKEAGSVGIDIYDRMGKKLKTFGEQSYSAGSHSSSWDGSTDGGEKVASGLYIALFKVNGSMSVKRKIIVIR